MKYAVKLICDVCNKELATEDYRFYQLRVGRAMSEVLKRADFILCSDECLTKLHNDIKPLNK